MHHATDSTDRAKAILLVAALHAGLGAALILGLGAEQDRRTADNAASFDVAEPLSITMVEPPPPETADSGARDEPAPPNLRSTPAPIVAPDPAVDLPVLSPVRTAELRTPPEGADRTAGAAEMAGPGTGAGGSGDGSGGGGLGGPGAGFGGPGGASARLLSGNLTNRDYRRIRDYGSPRGEATLGIAVGPNGRLVDCRPLLSSGNPSLDQELCALLARTRWAPALAQGRPVTAQLRYVATWDRN